MEILKYLSIREKLQLVELVVNNSFTEDGEYSNIMKEVMFDYAVTIFYSDLYKDLDEDRNLFDVYDEIHQNGTIEEVMKCIPYDEIGFLKNNIQTQIDQKLNNENNINVIINNFLNNLIQSIPSEKSINKIIKNLKKEFKNIDPKNLDMLKGLLNSSAVK